MQPSPRGPLSGPAILVKNFLMLLSNVAAVYTQLLATSQTNLQLFPSFPLKRTRRNLKMPPSMRFQNRSGEPAFDHGSLSGYLHETHDRCPLSTRRLRIKHPRSKLPAPPPHRRPESNKRRNSRRRCLRPLGRP